MTYTEKMKDAIEKIDALQLPEDTRKSRLNREPKPEPDEEIIRAAERFAEFRRLYPEGFVDTDLGRAIEHADGNVTYVMRANVWKDGPGGSPDASAWAQGSTKSQNPIIAAAPIESADTIARSRALRNLGILPTNEGKRDGTALGAIQDDQSIGSDITSAREASETSQASLAKEMRQRGFKWTQPTVAAIEKGERRLLLVEAQHLSEIIGFGSPS